MNNTMTPGRADKVTVTNISTGEVITEIPTSETSVSAAVKKARESKEAWNKMQGHIRARHLYRYHYRVQI